MTHGGKRSGAGRPKGKVSKLTKLKQKKKEALNTLILNEVEGIWGHQRQLIRGSSYLFVRTKNKEGGMGKAELVTDVEEIQSYLLGDYNKDEHYYYITTEKPNIKAIEMAFDRVFGKPKQSSEMELRGNLGGATININCNGNQHRPDAETDAGVGEPDKQEG